MGTLRSEAGEMRCAIHTSVFAVEALAAGPRVAIGPQASKRDVAILSLAAVAAQLAREHGWNAAELLESARRDGLAASAAVTPAGLILPPGTIIQ